MHSQFQWTGIWIRSISTQSLCNLLWFFSNTTYYQTFSRVQMYPPCLWKYLKRNVFVAGKVFKNSKVKMSKIQNMAGYEKIGKNAVWRSRKKFIAWQKIKTVLNPQTGRGDQAMENNPRWTRDRPSSKTDRWRSRNNQNMQTMSICSSMRRSRRSWLN